MGRLPDAKVEIEFELGRVLAKRSWDRDEDSGLVLRLGDASGPRQEVDEIVDERRVAELHEHGRSWSPRCPDARRGSFLTLGEDRPRVHGTNP
jgi:hypothetical protein